MDAELAEVVRGEWSRVVATLVHDLGDLELAEDAAQEAVLEATLRWPTAGVPDSPGAWLTTTARRKAIDRIRRERAFQDRLPHLVQLQEGAASAREPRPTGLVDDQLALFLGCCHPALAEDAQVALSLRAVAGLSVRQIARAFLVPAGTMERRLTRAKAKIRAAGIPFRVPDRGTLVDRLSPVRHVVATIFTEGHTRSDGATLVHGDLCDEAVWLVELLVRLVPDDAETRGLAALIAFSDARRGTRFDRDGALVLLEDQDRSAWDVAAIERGREHLSVAHELADLGPFQLEAAVAAVHATAPTFADTDWSVVVALYEALVLRSPSPVVELNRAVAVSYRDGPDAGLALVDPLVEVLADYAYLHAARGELLVRLGRADEAADALDEALRCCTNEVEAAHLRARRAAVAPPLT